MLDRLKQIPERLLEMWKSWTKTQKIIIVSAVAAFIAAVVIIAYILSRPDYQELTKCEDYSEMNTVTTLLTDNNYKYEIDNMTVKVEKKNLTNAKMLIASNDIKPSGYSLDDALNSSLTTTESDKNKKYAKYLETKFANDISSLDGVKSASVTVHLSDDTNSFYATKKDTTVAVTIDTTKTLGDDTAESIAVLLATAVGNSNTNGITIIDTSGKTLFNGADNSGSTSNIAYSSKLKYKAQIENTVAASVKNTALSTSLFNDATVAINLDLDWDTVNKIATEYQAQEGREEGLYKDSYELESNGTNGASGTPGTTSNGESGTTYDLTDGTSSSSTYTVRQYSYLPNEFVTTTTSDPGKIVYDTSTMAVTLIKNIIYNEDECKNLGYLDNMTWDEFKAQNANPVQVEVNNDWMNMFSNATGISTDRISVLAYNVPYFYDTPKTSILNRASFWIQIALAVAILGILVVVVLRSARPLTVEEKEPELSVEEMLASTKENQPSVDEIDLQEKSETRKAIEKFVDENPEAVALLLRNWLNDDW